MTVGELKEALKGVPDDYLCIIELEGMDVVGIDVDDKSKTVDVYYK